MTQKGKEKSHTPCATYTVTCSLNVDVFTRFTFGYWFTLSDPLRPEWVLALGNYQHLHDVDRFGDRHSLSAYSVPSYGRAESCCRLCQTGDRAFQASLLAVAMADVRLARAPHSCNTCYKPQTVEAILELALGLLPGSSLQPLGAKAVRGGYGPFLRLLRTAAFVGITHGWASCTPAGLPQSGHCAGARLTPTGNSSLTYEPFTR